MSTEFLTVKQLQKILKISRVNAYKIVKDPSFPTFRVGNQIRIPKDALDRWIAEQLPEKEAV